MPEYALVNSLDPRLRGDDKNANAGFSDPPSSQPGQSTTSQSPHTTPRFFVFGEVKHPGPYRLTGHPRAVEILAQVGPTKNADISRIRLLDPRPDGSMRHLRQINLYRLLTHGDHRDNVRIGKGQVLYVPPTAIARISLAWRQLLGLD